MASWRVARSLEQLRAEVNARFPGRDLSSDGSIGDPAHQARVSDHNPNARGVVQARDFDENDASGGELVGDAIWELLLRTKPRRLKYAIYEGKILSSYAAHGYPPFTPRPFDGNAHPQHIHVSVQDDPALYDDASPWGLSAPAPVKEDVPVDAVILLHPTNGISDSLAGLLGAAIRPDLEVAVTFNANVAKRALKAGKRVHAVGGPACDMVAGDRDLRGANRLDTADKVVAQAAKGW